MKLAVIFPESLPLKKARAVSVVNTVAELSKLVDTTFVIPESSGSKKEIENFYEVDLRHLKLLRLKNKLLGIKSSKVFNFFFRRYIKNFDVFYVRHLKVAKFLVENKLPHQKVIFEVHEVFHESLKEEAPFKEKKILQLKALESFVYSRIDGAVFTSFTLKDFWEKNFGLVSLSKAVIPHAVKNIPPFIEKDFSELKEIYYCGSFYRWKGIEVAFYALAKVPELRLKLVGGGEKRRVEELRELAQRLDIIDRIEFLGFKPPEEVFSLLKKEAKLTLIPNARSVHNFFSFPIKMLEYMATSNLVIAADTPVIKDVIKDGKNGFLFKTGETDELAKTLKLVMTLPQEKLFEVSKMPTLLSKILLMKKELRKFTNFVKKIFKRA